MPFTTNLFDDMRTEDEFISEWSYATFEYARMTADEVAQATVKAVERRKLYVIPQLSGKVLWMTKRMSPGLFHGSLALLNRIGIGHSALMWMTRKGLL
jgi:short-subunit dehydrogenase